MDNELKRIKEESEIFEKVSLEGNKEVDRIKKNYCTWNEYCNSNKVYPIDKKYLDNK